MDQFLVEHDLNEPAGMGFPPAFQQAELGKALKAQAAHSLASGSGEELRQNRLAQVSVRALDCSEDCLDYGCCLARCLL